MASSPDTTSTGGDDAVEVGAISALLQADQGSNQTVQETTVAIIGIVLTYLAATLFVVANENREIPFVVLMIIPIPPLLLQTLQMVWTAGVVGRAASAERLEEELARRAGPTIARLYGQGLIGSLVTTRITDVRKVNSAGKVAELAARVPYYGFYLLTCLFTIYALNQAYRAESDDPGMLRWWVLGTAAYLGFAALFVSATRRAFMLAGSSDGEPVSGMRLEATGSRRLSIGVAAVAFLGIVAQIAQTEDPTPVAAYFTIWSAVVSGLGWLLLDFRTTGRLERIICAAGSLGSILSGVVYWTAIFPENRAGDSVLTVAANLVLHLVLPAVVVVRLVVGRATWRLPFASVAATMLLPATYVVVSLVSSRITGEPSPYAFLRPSEDLPLFVAFCCGFAATWLLGGLVWRERPHGHHEPAADESRP